jgi:uncharacterized membrane protein (DUF485 family)
MSAVAAPARATRSTTIDVRFQAHHSVWDGIAATPQFRRLTNAKRAFIIPVFLFFAAYTLALPVLDGYAPHFMSAKVFGTMSRAYVFALSQILVTWVIAWRYIKVAEKFDRLAKDIVVQAEDAQGGK